MRSTPMIDTLEGRSMLSAAPRPADGSMMISTGADGATLTVNGTEVHNTFDLSAAGGGKATFINSEAGSSADPYGMMGQATRHGLFSLPTISADGSANLTGSDDADQITIERTSGIHDTLNDRGLNANGGYVFVNVIGPDGRRHIQGLPGRGGGIEVFLNYAIKQHELSNPDISGEETAASSVKAAALLSNIKSKLAAGDFIHYSLKGVYDYYVEVSPDSSQARINIDGGAGADNISVSQNVPMKLNLNGGSGADKLTSGKKLANLGGGGGNDLLVSRSTKGGTLDGGKGADRYLTTFSSTVIEGRADGDRVVNGREVYMITGATPLHFSRDAAGIVFVDVVDSAGNAKKIEVTVDEGVDIEGLLKQV